MGKYSNFFPQTKIVGDVPWQVALITAITQNNNELAEANRLKRLELKILGGNMDIPNTMAQISEDRA